MLLLIFIFLLAVVGLFVGPYFGGGQILIDIIHVNWCGICGNLCDVRG